MAQDFIDTIDQDIHSEPMIPAGHGTHEEENAEETHAEETA